MICLLGCVVVCMELFVLLVELRIVYNVLDFYLLRNLVHFCVDINGNMIFNVSFWRFSLFLCNCMHGHLCVLFHQLLPIHNLLNAEIKIYCLNPIILGLTFLKRIFELLCGVYLVKFSIFGYYIINLKNSNYFMINRF